MLSYCIQFLGGIKIKCSFHPKVSRMVAKESRRRRSLELPLLKWKNRKVAHSQHCDYDLLLTHWHPMLLSSMTFIILQASYTLRQRSKPFQSSSEQKQRRKVATLRRFSKRLVLAHVKRGESLKTAFPRNFPAFPLQFGVKEIFRTRQRGC